MLGGSLALLFARRCSAHGERRLTEERAKNRRPLSIGRGLRGGRWPGPEVERDGEKCYRDRGWVTTGSEGTKTTVEVRNTVVTRDCCF